MSAENAGLRWGTRLGNVQAQSCGLFRARGRPEYLPTLQARRTYRY